MDYYEFMIQLAERYNDPLRPQLSLAISTLGNIKDPNDGWKCALEGGLLPESFGKDRRRFGKTNGNLSLMPKDRPSEHLWPSTIQALVTVASDPTGFLEAERQARALTHRLIPCAAVCNDEVVWYFSDNPYKHHPYEVAYLGTPFNAAIDTVLWTLDHYRLELEPIECMKDTTLLPVLVRETAAAWKGWEFAVTQGLKILKPRWPFDPSKWAQVRFSELENPFEPLLRLWCTGYRLVCDFETNDPTIRLYAKPVLLN
jgi:hypothetical protein